jgi:iron transport multicopper oxidase
VPEGLNWNVSGWLLYDQSKPLPDAAIILEDSFREFDDYTLVLYDKELFFSNPDQSITLEVVINNLGDGAN